ncbi:MAG: GlcNAc-transferase family protein [Vicinamibacterales bacterium]
MPAISVVMPVRDGARFLAEALDAVLAQTFEDFELIVVDDGSTDDTPRILDRYAARDGRLVVLRNPTSLGVGAALNRGCAAARGDLIARMDADDRCDPGRFAAQKAFLDAHPHVVLCGTGTWIIDATGAVTGVSEAPTGDAVLRDLLRTQNTFVAGSTMFRKREAENAGLFSPDPAFLYAEDYECWVRLAARHQVDNLQAPLYSYRVYARENDAERAAVQRASADRIRTLAAAWLDGGGFDLQLPRHHTPVPRGRIFVQIASYRDPECQWTIRDLFSRAARPDDITVGVCWQYEPRFDEACFRIRTRPDQVRVVDVHMREARGLGWARHLTEQLWQGEDYVLQVDAHMRFADGWDDLLLEELAACNSRYPILTVYPWGYRPPRTLHDGPPLRMAALRFGDNGLLAYVGTVHGDPPRRPAPQAFWAGGFAFSRAEVIREVPQDPHLFFNETEMTHAVRLWTHGWDLFAPARNLIWHCYGPDKRVTHAPWSDDQRWVQAATLAQQRTFHLLQVRQAEDPAALVDLPRYALGRHRTLADYQAFAGVRFADRTITDEAKNGYVRAGYARPRAS